jgi:hypothetical protein
VKISMTGMCHMEIQSQIYILWYMTLLNHHLKHFCKIQCKYIDVGLFFKGQDSAYPSNLRLPESSHTWSTEGSQPGNEMHSARVRSEAIYHRRLRINTTPPEPNEQLHIVCQHCNLHLQVPQNLLKSDTGYQKLRCGACWKISCFQLYPSRSSPEHSPAGSKNMSPLMSCQFSPNVSDGLCGCWRDPATKLVTKLVN